MQNTKPYIRGLCGGLSVVLLMLIPLVTFHFRRDTRQTLDKLAITSVIAAAVMFWKGIKLKGGL